MPVIDDNVSKEKVLDYPSPGLEPGLPPTPVVSNLPTIDTDNLKVAAGSPGTSPGLLPGLISNPLVTEAQGRGGRVPKQVKIFSVHSGWGTLNEFLATLVEPSTLHYQLAYAEGLGLIEYVLVEYTR